MKIKTKWIWAAATIAGIALIIVLLRPNPISVDVVPITRGPMSVTVEEQGQTRVRERYTVAAPITGRLLRTQADEGMRIERGDLLGSMVAAPEDPRFTATALAATEAARARVREAEARLNEAESSNELAQNEADRRSRLFEQGVESEETRDAYRQAAAAAEANVSIARAALDTANAELRAAESRLLGLRNEDDQTEANVEPVRAPISGTVLRVHEESERVVQAGMPLFDLGADNELEIVVDVLTEDAVDVQPDNPIEISNWGGQEMLMGRVRYVEPAGFTKISTLGVEEQRVNVIGDILNSPSSLGIGYRIEAAIVTWTSEDTLRIPTSAIFQRDEEWHTFVVEEDRARLRQVTIGHRATGIAEVLDGVDDGDRVITFPSDLVRDGVRVQL